MPDYHLRCVVCGQAENILNWAPPGTHDHSKFVKPDELVAVATEQGLTVTGVQGMTFSVGQQARSICFVFVTRALITRALITRAQFPM